MKTSEFDRALLQSAAEDGPSAEQRRANRAAVMRAAGVVAAAGMATASTTASSAPAAGVSTGAGTAAGGAAGTGGVGAGVGTAAKSVAASASKLLLWAKISSAVVVLGGVAGVAVVATRSSDDVRVPTMAHASASKARSVGPAAASPGTTREPTAHEPTPEPSPAVENVQGVETEAPARAVLPVARDGTGAKTSSLASSTSQGATPHAGAMIKPRATVTVDPLASEVALLETARRCLDASDIACSAENLGAHRARFGRGTLADEAMVLRIDLARAQGNATKARALAQQLLDEHPGGPYAARAKAVLAEP